MTVLDNHRTYPELPHPSQSAVRFAARLGPIYELRALGVRYVVAAGAEFVTDLNDETRFCKHLGPEIAAMRIVGGDGLFTAYNDEPNWQKAHDLLMPAFSQAAMHGYHGVMLDTATEFTQKWDERARVGGTVDVSADTTRVTLESIARCAAGYSFGSFRSDAVPPFVGHMVSGLKGADRVGAMRASRLPKFVARREERKVRRDAAYMHGVADEIVARRRAEGVGRHDDLLDIMLGSDLDAANIRYQLMNFLVAGHETTSGALSFTLYYLSHHPEVYARARAEVDEVWGSDPRPGVRTGRQAAIRAPGARRSAAAAAHGARVLPGRARGHHAGRRLPDGQGRLGAGVDPDAASRSAVGG